MSDVAYYLRREQAERELAEAARDPAVRAIHETLAGKYGELAHRELDALNFASRLSARPQLKSPRPPGASRELSLP